MRGSEVMLIAVVVVFTLVCLVTDVRTRRIPNWITVPVFGLGVLVHTIMGGMAGFQFSLLGFATGFGVLFVLWWFGGGGGGDVKMMGALGAWLGAWLTLQVFVASAVATLLLLAGTIVIRAIVPRLQGTSKDTADRRKGKSAVAAGRRKASEGFGRVMPYAVPLAVGTWAVLFYAWRMGGLP